LKENDMTKNTPPAWAALADEIDRKSRRARLGRPHPTRLAFTVEDCPAGGSVVVPPGGIGNGSSRLRAQVSVPDELREQIQKLAPSAGLSPALVSLAAWAAEELQRRGQRLIVTSRETRGE
jgi:hypothetical protein